MCAQWRIPGAIPDGVVYEVSEQLLRALAVPDALRIADHIQLYPFVRMDGVQLFHFLSEHVREVNICGARSRNAAASIYAAAGTREAASASHCARTRMRDRFIPGDVALRRPDFPSRLGERLPSDRGVPQGRGPRSACVEPGLAASA
ncbi:hypothetical protein KBK24_0105125 [Burkholderia sp. K24]|nr:hypothetical protein KBK24_0105125 [Burkholderia sp. K24]